MLVKQKKLNREYYIYNRRKLCYLHIMQQQIHFYHSIMLDGGLLNQKNSI